MTKHSFSITAPVQFGGLPFSSTELDKVSANGNGIARMDGKLHQGGPSGAGYKDQWELCGETLYDPRCSSERPWERFKDWPLLFSPGHDKSSSSASHCGSSMGVREGWFSPSETTNARKA